MSSRDDAFVAYVAARRRHLQRVAYLLTGSWTDAEDLVQTTLTKLYVAWRRVGHDQPEAYARQVMLRTHLDDRRRAWHRRERATDTVPERLTPVGASFEDADAVRAALALLTPRQRATVVSRYWLDLSVEQTASELGCSSGTVKSQTARALAVLRRELGPAFAEPGTQPVGHVVEPTTGR